MNASDARNKKILDNRLMELLGNRQMDQFYGAKKGMTLLFKDNRFSRKQAQSDYSCVNNGRSRWYEWQSGSWRSKRV